MATDIATSQDGGISNLAQGSFTGAGAAVDCVCGFKPRYVKVINLTDRTTYEITADMAAGKALKAVAAGTLTEDTAGILLYGGDDDAGYRGFLIPAAIAISAKSLYWVAFG